jgi:cyanate permease
MSRKPLLRFETSERAQLIASSMPSSAAGKRKRKPGKKNLASSNKPKVVKGKVALRVAGYSGLQKIAPSTLIPFLPATKLRQAAKRALSASGKKTVRRKQKSKK